jgi:hypothetical protein
MLIVMRTRPTFGKRPSFRSAMRRLPPSMQLRHVDCSDNRRKQADRDAACGKFDGQFHRLLVSDGTELKLCHERALTSVRFKHEVAVNDHAHRKPRPDRQRRLDVEILLNDLLSGLVEAIAGSTAEC